MKMSHLQEELILLALLALDEHLTLFLGEHAARIVNKYIEGTENLLELLQFLADHLLCGES